jgi:hypothetical protein
MLGYNQQRTIEQYFTQYTSELINRVPRSSGKLADSIDYKYTENSDGTVDVDITMLEYGKYIDKGVNGVKKSWGSIYGYTTKMPPPKSLDKWIVKQGLAPKDKHGKFLNRKSIQFAIARSIYNNGIKPTLFLSRDYDERMEEFAGLFTEAYWDDFADGMNDKNDKDINL